MTIPELAKQLIEYGVKTQAQDLYILPKQQEMAIFFRYSEKKRFFQFLSYEKGEKLIFHFKFISRMDVGEKRKTQMGSVSYFLEEKIQRLRMSTVGDYQNRESLVVRFLHQFGTSMENYLLPFQLHQIEQQLKRSGLFLFCGPVGSGKTTLMYKLARQRNEEEQIITVEDPVEIIEERFLQLQTNEKINLTYDVLIKLCLRHRPDILIIGEIRDEPTAKAAVRAALTGHTVFATLHARSVQGVRPRLQELGIQKRELKECLEGIVFQQLIACAVSTEKTKAGLLFDYEFTKGKTPADNWKRMLRKAWAYGLIKQETFEQLV